MQTFRVTFQGRKSGAIGVFYPITETVKVENVAGIIPAIGEKGFELNHIIRSTQYRDCAVCSGSGRQGVMAARVLSCDYCWDSAIEGMVQIL